jgi:hypothetical protein
VALFAAQECYFRAEELRLCHDSRPLVTRRAWIETSGVDQNSLQGNVLVQASSVVRSPRTQMVKGR